MLELLEIKELKVFNGELEEVLEADKVLVEVLDFKGVQVATGDFVKGHELKGVLVAVVVLVEVFDCVGDNDGRITLLSPIPVAIKLNNINSFAICIYTYVLRIHISKVGIVNEVILVLRRRNCSEAFSIVSVVRDTCFLISRKGPCTFIEGNCNLIGGKSLRTISFVPDK